MPRGTKSVTATDTQTVFSNSSLAENCVCRSSYMQTDIWTHNIPTDLRYTEENGVGYFLKQSESVLLTTFS